MKIKKSISILFVLCIVIGMGVFSSYEVQAATEKGTCYFWMQPSMVDKDGARIVHNEWGSSLGEKVKISKVKSSNKKVVKVSGKNNKKEGAILNTKLVSPGTATVSYTIQADGKTTNYKYKYVVEKYQCPLAEFTIGETDYLSKFQKNSEFTTDKAKKGKLNVKATDGWEIKKITYFAVNKKYKIVEKKIKNGAVVKFDGIQTSLWIKVKNKETGFTSEISYTYLKR